MRYPQGKEYMHPKTIKAIEALKAECKKQGLDILITEGYRTMREQDALYAKGRTAQGGIVTNCKGNSYQSPHQWGVAFDFCRNVKGREYDDSDGFFSKVGAIGKKLGLFWGGDFKSFKDKPHFQLHELIPSLTTAVLKAKYGTPEAYRKTWGVMPELKRGDKGESVVFLQVALQRKGYSVKADGDFGPMTLVAVKQFQKLFGVSDTGIVKQNTWEKLM